MTFRSVGNTHNLIIQENERLKIEDFELEVLSYLGYFTTNVHYFKVNIISTDRTTTSIEKLGLLRVGSADSGLSRELRLREALQDYKLIAPLLAHTIEDSVLINPRSLSNEEQKENGKKYILSHSDSETAAPKNQGEKHLTLDVEKEAKTTPDSITDEGTIFTHELIETSPDEEQDDSKQNAEFSEEILESSIETETELEYLEEEYYPEKEIATDSFQPKLILLTYLPDEKSTLETCIEKNLAREESLSLAIQVCQCFSYIFQRGWCFTDIIPKFIKIGQPIELFDLTSAYPVGEKLSCGLMGNYCAPELAQDNLIHESMSSYSVGALLYQLIHKQIPQQYHSVDIVVSRIPKIYQILTICLSPIPEERFILSQLLSLLIDTRQSLRQAKIDWDITSRSTVGLSTHRLQNEDSYGVRRQQIGQSESMILGIVADGMGGMSQGELASKLAVKTALEEPLPSEFKMVEQRVNWLVSLFQKVNDTVADAVRDGGTTLSIVLVIGQELMIGHVGDSRIYLLRQGELHQLSEDHSLVAMMVASNQMTKEESLTHPDRNVLTKSIGSKRRLSDGYVQDLSRTTERLSKTIEDGDILLLCSDGVWDLVSDTELAETFTRHQSLQAAVDEIISQVIDRGASDNATILALKCCIDKVY
jgi:PPM family protein phosphatase